MKPLREQFREWMTAKTQTQNLCALVRFYHGCLGKPLGNIGKFEYAIPPAQRITSPLDSR